MLDIIHDVAFSVTNRELLPYVNDEIGKTLSGNEQGKDKEIAETLRIDNHLLSRSINRIVAY